MIARPIVVVVELRSVPPCVPYRHFTSTFIALLCVRRRLSSLSLHCCIPRLLGRPGSQLVRRYYPIFISFVPSVAISIYFPVVAVTRYREQNSVPANPSIMVIIFAIEGCAYNSMNGSKTTRKMIGSIND